MVCLQLKVSFVEYKFFNMEWRMLILYVENSNFCIIMSWFSQVGSDWVTVLLVIVGSGRIGSYSKFEWLVGSQKLDL